MGRVLVVDDDVRLSGLLSRYLGEQGFSVEVAADGEEMYGALDRQAFDLLILDVNLPGEDGMVLCDQLRRRGNRIPVIMLTARGDGSDRVGGLELGADDYLTKPFNPRELIARMRAVLRRQPLASVALHQVSDICYRFNGFELDVSRQSLNKNGEQIHLSTAEYALLRIFLAEPGHPLPRELLVARMTSREFQSDQRSVDMLISRLRKRLDSMDDVNSMIRTVRGVGYMLVAEVSKGSCK